MSTPVPTETVAPYNVINLSFDGWSTIVFSINWLIMLGIIVLIVVLSIIIPKLLKKAGKHRKVKLEGIKFGIKDFSCELSCGNQVEEIAYKLWIELTTRKIAIPLEDTDVVVEVYNSWYAAFGAIREQLKAIPGTYLDDSSVLIDLTTRVLNEGLRPHLTKWQAQFRSWFSANMEKGAVPQEVQRQYPKFDELWSEMKQTNQCMIAFAQELEKIAFGK